MSNRKLRHELDELKKQVEDLRKELAARPYYSVVKEYIPAPYPQPVPLPQYPKYPGYPDTIITCLSAQPAAFAQAAYNHPFRQ